MRLPSSPGWGARGSDGQFCDAHLDCGCRGRQRCYGAQRQVGLSYGYLMEECLFCRIIAGEIPADIVHRDEEFVAFRDINPQAPVHVLVIPTEHVPNAATYAENDPAAMGRLLRRAGYLAKQLDVSVSGYRLVFNTGSDGGQMVDHVHLHLLGGRRMIWPPG